MFPFFLKCVNYVLILNGERVSVAAREQLLNSTSRCPSYLFFGSEERQLDDEVSSLLADLNTSLVLCSGEVRSVKKYANLSAESFFLKKEGQQMLFCLTRICKDWTYALPTELLTELTSLPVSASQKPVDDQSKNQDNSGTLVLTENTLDQTGQHCLSMVREIVIENHPTSEELTVVKNVLSFIPHPRDILIHGTIFTSYNPGLLESIVTNIHFSDNLFSLKRININLTSTCVSKIASSLHQAGNLHELDLSSNPLLGYGIMDLAKRLNFVSCLGKLRLCYTGMGEEEVSSLANALKDVSKLYNLDLSNNSLGRGVSVLIQHLSSVPKLAWLCLRLVVMTKTEAEGLCTACARHISLSTDYHASDTFLWTFICTL